MRELLKEYIKNILLTQKLYEAKSKGALNTTDDVTLLSNKVLGYAAEWAVYAALGGTGDLKDMLTDKRISGKSGNDGPYPLAAGMKGKSGSQKEFDKIYKQMIAAVKIEISKKKLSLGEAGAAPGAGTQKVDVMSTLADIHVKYNDLKRLLGFQKDKEESDVKEPGLPLKKGETTKITSSKFVNTATVYDDALIEFFEVIRTKGNKIYKGLSDESKGAFNKQDLRTSHHSGPRLSGRKAAKAFGVKSKQYKGFLAYKAAYQEAIKIVGRKTFYDILETNGFKETLLRDIEQLLFISANKMKNAKGKEVGSKKIYFAKFSGPNIDSLGSVVTCEFYDYSKILELSNGLIDKMDVIRYLGPQPKQNDDALGDAVSGEKDGNSAVTTTFYQIVDKQNGTVYFDIEFRLDGDSHPPQLKAASGITKLGS